MTGSNVVEELIKQIDKTRAHAIYEYHREPRIEVFLNYETNYEIQSLQGQQSPFVCEYHTQRTMGGYRVRLMDSTVPFEVYHGGGYKDE